MNRINKSILYIISIAAVIGCAKNEDEGTNVANKRFFDAWISVNHPKAEKTDLGVYIIEKQDGTGAEVKEDGYAIVEFTATDLDGNITSYTGKEVAKQLGAYDTTTYYGPQVWLTQDETIQAGIQNAIVGMKVGGRKKVVIPSWLMTYSSYSTEKEYLNHSSDYSNAIYDFTVVDYADDINTWQIQKMQTYMTENFGGYDTFKNDTTGFYFKQLAPKTETEKEFNADTTIYINYTGKLLSGLVFDTTYERVAKDNGLYDASRTYEPVSITWASEYSSITMGSSSSSVINGFARTLWNMRNMGEEGKYDKAVGIFYSPLGYGYSGSGASIPPYAPLVFEIEIVAEPEE